MKNMKSSLLRFATVALIGLTLIACGDTGDGSGSDAGRWSSGFDSSSSVTISHSVAKDNICTITVGGKAEDQLPAWDRIWKAIAGYKYTPQAGKRYEFIFQAWTDGPDRKLTIHWYTNNDDQKWLDTGYENDGTPKFKINSTPTTYNVITDVIDKSGEQGLEFYCANQTGTFYVKMLEIREYSGSGLTDVFSIQSNNSSLIDGKTNYGFSFENNSNFLVIVWINGDARALSPNGTVSLNGNPAPAGFTTYLLSNSTTVSFSPSDKVWVDVTSSTAKFYNK